MFRQWLEKDKFLKESRSDFFRPDKDTGPVRNF